MDTDPAFTALTGRLLAEAPLLLRQALRKGGTYADLFGEYTTRHAMVMDKQRQHRAQSKMRHGVEAGVGIQVLGPRHHGFAATSDLDELTVAADAAADQVGGARPLLQPLPLDPLEVHLELPHDAPDQSSDAWKVDLLEKALYVPLAFDPNVARVEVAYQDWVRRVVVLTSEGHARAWAQPMVGLRVTVVLDTPDGPVYANAVSGGPFGLSHFLMEMPEAVAMEAVTRARVLASAQQVPAGSYPIVLASGWGGVWLHEAIGHLLEADLALAGQAPPVHGQRLGTDGVTLHDDAQRPNGRGTNPFDDEGQPAQTTVLVEDGYLRGLLTDRRTAQRYARRGTGNGRRQDYRHPPLPRMTNLVLTPGPHDPDELVRDVPDGLYICQIGRGRIAPDRTTYSFDVLEGYRIEAGRITFPVTGLRVQGRCQDALQALVGVANDFKLETARGLCSKHGQVVPVSVGMPTVLLHGLDVVPV